MKVSVAICYLLLVVVCCSAQLNQDQQDQILQLHNNARANADPIPQTPLQPLTWDPKIASDAQAWASQCTQNYSPNYYKTIYGENPLIQRPSLDVASAFNLWFSQGTSYNFNDGSCATSNCMNFQQIVSSTTTSIGCGVATCSFGTFFVCDYKTFSQYSGVLAYTPVASQPTSAPPPTPTRAPTVIPSTSGTHASSSSSSSTTGTPSSTSSSSGYASIDYRGTKAVVGVHDQKQCGSCWAFSSVTIIEGALGLRGLTVPMLSDQNVLDCSGGGSCDGGWTPTALKGMISKAGIESNTDYPYTQQQGTCAYTASKSQGAITKTGQTKGDFASIYNALATYGPVGIAVNAPDSWFNYKSGVLSNDATDINHAVTVVGYDNTLDAWIVKNSWGPTWGMSGFFYLSVAHSAGASQSGAFWAQ